MMAFLSGLLLALSFPKFNLFWLAWVALVPFLLALLRAKDMRAALLCGFWFGIGFFAINFIFVFNLFRFAGWWILLGWACLVLSQTIFMLLFAFLFRLSRTTNILWMGLLWVAVEWIRGWGPLGDPFGVLGYSQAPFLPIIQIASFSSVFGISLLIVISNMALANVIHERSKYHKVVLGIVLAGMVCLIVWGSLYPSPASQNDTPLSQRERETISIIQPNIDQKDKMNPAKVAEVFNIHAAMTRQAFNSHPDIVIWPETSLFVYALHDPIYAPQIINLAREGHCWLVMGMPEYDTTGEYNSIVVVSPSGEVVGRYDKERLVPFGEYLPFRQLLLPILKQVGYYDDEFHAGTNSPAPLIAGKARMAAVICSESAFPDLVRKRIDPKTNFILCVTNDSWFGDSSLPYLHINVGKLRAIENRQYFVQVGNTGISALIDPNGRVVQQTKLGQRTILTFQIPLP